MTEIPEPRSATGFGMTETLRHNIDALVAKREREQVEAPRGERIAAAITRFTGSMTFVYLHVAIYGAWILVNVGLVPGLSPFDPSFVILASEASVEAIFLSTFVLISQNRMTVAADRRADLDLHINLLTEHELTRLAALVARVADRLGVDSKEDPEFEEVTEDVDPLLVSNELDKERDDETP